MRAARLLAVLLLLPMSTTAAPDDADDWKLVGGMLSMMQQLVHLAAQSSDPKAVEREVDAMLSGQSAQANRLAAGMMEEILRDVPLEQRSAFVSIGHDLLTIARRERARAGAVQTPQDQSLPAPALADRSTETALRARKELHAMGLRYWDEQQFAEAARRGDRIAVDLYLASQGLSAAAVARNLPPAR